VDDDATSTVATVEAVERIPQEQVEAVVRGTTLAANATGSTSSQPLSTTLATASSTTAVNRARALTPQEIL
jgi:hypothetical protein